MIGIEITAENKADNNLRESVGSVMTRGKYPNVWQGTEKGMTGGYANRTDLHKADGWRSVIYPTLGVNQRQGAIYFDADNDVFTYHVIDKTDEEIQQEQISASESVKENRIKEISDSLILEAVYNETDIETVLTNTDLYPLFEVGIAVLNATDAPNDIPYRCKDFNLDNELVLWEAVLSHTTQEDWHPKDVPSLFKRVAAEGEIPVWVQPLGSFDAYQIGDLVHFPTITDAVYENTYANNTYAPDVYGWVLYNG